ncbi:MAG TPA: DsrE family protein [Anaerolineae bacterium]|nr:DsrE family protein [Anaerolineae bacterium]
MSTNGKTKMVVVCNNAQTGIMPTLIMSTSGIALDYEVIVFFCPGGSPMLLKGELEKLGTPKGLPNPVNLFNTLLDQGGTVILCELALEAKDIKPEDLRDPRIAIKNAPSFLMDAEGATMTLSF